MRVDPNSYLSLDSLPVDTLEIDLVEYWRRIYYTLKAKELKSLVSFLESLSFAPRQQGGGRIPFRPACAR